MKKIFSEKIVAIFLVFVAFLISGYFYKEGKIKIFPSKNKKTQVQNTIAEVPFTEKSFQLAYNSLPSAPILEIADFEDKEKWSGDGEYDFSTFNFGETSLFLSSQNGIKAQASLKLQRGFVFESYLIYKLYLNLRTDVSNIEELKFSYIGANGQKYQYSIREISNGWNLLILEKEKFTKTGSVAETTGEGERTEEIKEISIELTSRPKTAASINFDYLWAEKSDKYLEEWNVSNPKLVSLGTIDSFPATLFLGSGTAVLKKITSAKDYSFKARFKPLTKGQFGLFLRGNLSNSYGYYFSLDGIDSSTWQISKFGIFDEGNKSIVLAKGEVSNFKMEKGKFYFLKAQLTGNKLTFWVSVNDKDYGQITEIRDDSFASGGVGLFSRGATFLVDGLIFLQ